MDKADIIIETALERYKPIATERVKEQVCSHCPDRRCERGERCKTYNRFVQAVAWALASQANNQIREGGEFGQSKN